MVVLAGPRELVPRGRLRPVPHCAADHHWIGLGPAGVSAQHDIQDEIIRISTDARPIGLQVALLVPILAGLVGIFNSFRMVRLPDPVSSSSVEGVPLG
jgi:hypothetical protein